MPSPAQNPSILAATGRALSAAITAVFTVLTLGAAAQSPEGTGASLPDWAAPLWAVQPRQIWQPVAPAVGAAAKPYRCRIVSYADKWSRHGLSNYMWWRWPQGPLAPKMNSSDFYTLTHDVDLDGDGDMKDDYVASLPFSLTQPLSNPEWPLCMAFSGRRSGRFYGGVSWMVANSTPDESRFWLEMGFNMDHWQTWFDPRAEDHPLQGQANEKKPSSFHKH